MKYDKQFVNTSINSTKFQKILLNGGLNSSKHTLNKKNADKWIHAQTSVNRKLAAETIIQTVKYISYADIVHQMKKAAGKFIRTIQQKNYTVVLPTNTTNSSMIMSLLFMYFVKQQDPAVYETCKIAHVCRPNNTNHIYVNIDDIDYSGNQADSREHSVDSFITSKINAKVSIHLMKFRSIATKQMYYDWINQIHIQLLYGGGNMTLYAKSKVYLYNRSYMNKIGIPYMKSKSKMLELTRVYLFNLYKQTYIKPTIYRIRAYQSSHVVDNKAPRSFVNVTFIRGMKLYSFNELVIKTFPDDYKKRIQSVAIYWCLCDDTKLTKNTQKTISTLTTCPLLNIYTDYKIADPNSTFTLPLLSGYVPVDIDYATPDDIGCLWSNNHLTDACDDVSDEHCFRKTKKGSIIPAQRFYALINKCSYGDTIRLYFEKHNYKIKSILSELADKQEPLIRCPSSWYKHINWNSYTIDKYVSRELLK